MKIIYLTLLIIFLLPIPANTQSDSNPVMSFLKQNNDKLISCEFFTKKFTDGRDNWNVFYSSSTQTTAQGCPLYVIPQMGNFTDGFTIAHLSTVTFNKKEGSDKINLDDIRCVYFWTMPHKKNDPIQGFLDCPSEK